MTIQSCNYKQAVRTGIEAYELKQFATAIPLFKKEFQQAKARAERARLAFLLAHTYEELQQIKAAQSWYTEAYELGYGDRAKLSLAFMHKQQEDYGRAIRLFQELLQSGANSSIIRGEIAICRLAADWKASTKKRYQITPCLFNSNAADYAPVFYANNIVFTSDRDQSKQSEVYNWTGRAFSNLYMHNERTGLVNSLDESINTVLNEGTASFANQGQTMYFVRCNDQDPQQDLYCKILRSDITDGTWGEASVLPFIQSNVNYGTPYWSERDSLLFFSAKFDSGYGGYDLYVTQLHADATWGDMQSLGARINSAGDEKFPYILEDTLYFASNGHLGMGGYDIFKSYMTKTGYIRPKNMKSPINSGADDFALVFAPNESYGYFTSAREGIDNIYRIDPRQVQDPVQDPETTKVDESKSLKLAVHVVLKEKDQPVRPFPEAQLVINQIPYKLSNRALYIMDVEPGVYDLNLTAPGCFAKKLRIKTSYTDIPENSTSYMYNETVVMEKMEAGQEIVLENILYDFNDSKIRDDAKPALIELANLLELNPKITIELSSHTDCRGPDAYNLKLSEARAKSAVQFIVNLGIDANRIQAKGYGETAPLESCACESCTEAAHQKNRRTSFKILSID